MKTLNQLGIKYGCDKSDIHHTFKGQTYLDVYETYFEKFKNSPIKFLELGVRQGQSISMWRDYFENAKVIVGLDISPECKVFEQGNIKIEIGSQADPMIIKNIINNMAATLSDFQIIKKLGDGAYSSVYKVRRAEDQSVYALKKVKMLNLSEKEKENALNEVRILASIQH